MFFIVLDLRLTKGWSTAVLLFFMPFRVGGLFKHGVTEIQSSFLRTVVFFPYCRPFLLSFRVPNLLCVKRFDDDAVGADLRVRPDAEVDVSRHW